jgi:hypothetical protein
MDLINTALPKWPQMLVTGKPVTIAQAKDIIFRTDDFLTTFSSYSGGNDHRFKERYRRDAGLDRFDKNPHNHDSPEFYQHFQAEHKAQGELNNALGIVQTEYVHNSWASTAYIHGPYGWCNPTGAIRYFDNIGKWPDVAEVLTDWTLLAKSFPYIDLTATLMSGEHCEEHIVPLVSIRVVNGTAELIPGTIEPHEHQNTSRGMFDADDLMRPDRERGLPMAWYKEFAEKVRTAAAESLIVT